MVEKKLGVVILLVLLVVPMVLATTTTINIKTRPEHDVILKTLDPNPGEGEKNILEPLFEGSTDANGEVSFISHASKSTINIWIAVLKNDVRVPINDKTYHEFKNNPTGGVINLEVKEKPLEPEVNETESNETEEVVEEVAEEETEEVEEPVIEEQEIEEEKEGSKVIGAIVGSGKAIVSSKMAYFIGGIIFAGILYLIVFAAQKKLKFKKGGTYLDFKIKDNKKEELKDKIEDKDKELADAERKIEEAKAELDDIRNRKTKLQEARERFERDKKELGRLEKD